MLIIGLLIGLASTLTVQASEQKKTLVILIHDVANFNALPSVETMEARMAAVSSNYLEYSYNQMGLAGVQDPGQAADVVGWYDYDGAADFNLPVFMAMADTNDAVDFTQYDAMVVVVATRPGSTLAAWSTIGDAFLNSPDGSIYIGWSKMSVPNASVTILTHELGHVFGTGESSFLDCGDEVISETNRSYVAYGDPYDVMNSINIGHFSAQIKERWGWMDGSNSIQTITTSGVYTVEPMETDTGGTKALKIQRTVNEHLYIEYRQPIGTDSEFDPGSDVFQGALFHAGKHLLNMTPPALPYGPQAPTDAQLTPALHPGQSFVDPLTGHRFTVSAANSNLLTVDIVHSGFEFTPPVVDLLSPSNASVLSGEVTLSAQATDDSTIDRVEFWYRRVHPPLLLATATGPGSNDVFELTFDSVDAIPNGPGQIWARAVDIYSNTTDSAWMDLVVGNATEFTPPEIVIDAPTPGSLATQNMVQIQMTASDNRKLWSVELFQDGDRHTPIYSSVATDSVHTAEAWLQNGPHRLTARATDYEGNQMDSAEMSFTVVTNTDTAGPWAYFTSPADNEVVSGTVTVQLDAGDNVAVTSVVFWVLDGFDPMLVQTNPPYTFPFNSATAAEGYHHFRAQIWDSSSNQMMAQTMFEIRQDGDADSLPDWWETVHFGGVSNADPATLSQNDRDTLLEAYIAGLDPTNAASAFQFQSSLAHHELNWSPRVTGRVYSVWISTNARGSYLPLSGPLPYTQTAYTNPSPPETPWTSYQIRVEME
jgi:Bacterial Ig domain